MMLFQCTNPVEKEPLRWHSVFDIPVSDEKFVLKKEFNNLFDLDSTMDLFDPDSVDNGDTLSFLLKKNKIAEFNTSKDNIETQTFASTLGVFKLYNAPGIGDTLPMLPSTGDFSTAIPITLDKIYEITFYDTIINILPVTVTNISPVPLTNVSVGLEGIDTGTVASIPANSSAVIPLDVRRGTLRHTVSVLLSGSSSVVRSGQIGLAMDFKDLLIERCKVDDHLVRFNVSYLASYDITDSLNLDYIDIKDGHFRYSIQNKTDIPFQILVNHLHLWQTSYCQGTNIQNISAVKSYSGIDSTKYSGNIYASYIPVAANSENAHNINLSSNRLFTEWNNGTRKSYTTVRYSVTNGIPRGDTVTVSARDSLKFTLDAGSFKFQELQGMTTDKIVRTADTQKIAIVLPKPWNESVTDSLRGKFVLKSIIGDLKMMSLMPDGAFIDTMNITLVAFPQNKITVRDSTRSSFFNVKDSAKFNRTVDLTAVTNEFPDTINFLTIMEIPQNTRLKISNDIGTLDYNLYARYIGRMIIQMNIDYLLNAKLEWTVRDTVTLDLGSSKFPVNRVYSNFLKLENRSVSMNFETKNQSNLDLSLFALVAPYRLIDSLKLMNSDSALKLVARPDLAESKGYINLFGKNGVGIPAKQVTVPQKDSIGLSSRQIELILNQDTCAWRWFAKFRPQNNDALHDSDYVDVTSWIHIDGINNSDSLFSEYRDGR
jgi:hypothetical protein